MFDPDSMRRQALLQQMNSPLPGGTAGIAPSAGDAQKQEIAAQAPTAPKTYNPMGGFDTGRLNDPNDLAPKYVYGRFAQNWQNDHGGQWNEEGLRAFVQQDPRWELLEKGGGGEPLLRVKQDELNKWQGKQGHESIWQDVFQDFGGKNGVQFENAMSPTPGFQASLAQPTFQSPQMSSPEAGMNVPSAQDQIQAEIQALIDGSLSPMQRQALLQQLGVQ